MTVEQASALLPWVTVAYGVICVGVGYIWGVQRGFAHLGYWGETLGEILSTLQPHCGDISRHRH